jgi:hypothetical protein
MSSLFGGPLNIASLEAYFQQIKNEMPRFRDNRVKWAYTDLLNSVNFANELIDDVKDEDIFELATNRETDKLQFVLKYYNRQAILLKAIYMFASIFVSILVGETTNSSELSLRKFIDKPKSTLQTLSVEQILPAYCVIVYRNKVITHHDLSRMNPNFPGSKGKMIYLVPFPEDFHIAKTNVTKIYELKEKYKETITELHNENNQFNLLRILFYNIPIGELGKLNPDRQEVDEIVEAGGCPSMSPDEILAAIDQFLVAVINALKTNMQKAG